MPQGKILQNRVDSKGYITITYFFGENFREVEEHKEDLLLNRLNTRLSENNIERNIKDSTQINISEVNVLFEAKENQVSPGVRGEIEVKTKEERIHTDLDDPLAEFTAILDILCNTLDRFDLLTPAYEEGFKRDCNISFAEFKTRPVGIYLETEKPLVHSPIALRVQVDTQWSMSNKDIEKLKSDIRNTIDIGVGEEYNIEIDNGDLVIQINTDEISYRQATRVSNVVRNLSASYDGISGDIDNQQTIIEAL